MRSWAVSFSSILSVEFKKLELINNTRCGFMSCSNFTCRLANIGLIYTRTCQSISFVFSRNQTCVLCVLETPLAWHTQFGSVYLI